MKREFSIPKFILMEEIDKADKKRKSHWGFSSKEEIIKIFNAAYLIKPNLNVTDICQILSMEGIWSYKMGAYSDSCLRYIKNSIKEYRNIKLKCYKKELLNDSD